MFAVFPTWCIAHFKLDCLLRFLQHHFSIKIIFVECLTKLSTGSLNWVLDLCSFSRVTMGILAASLITVLLMHSWSKWLCCSRFASMALYINFQINWSVLNEMFKFGMQFINLTLLTCPKPHDWPAFLISVSSCCCLFINVCSEASEAFTAKLHSYIVFSN